MKLYIVHGWAYSIEPWSQTVAYLRQHGVEVVQLKVPGLTAPSDKIWTVDDYVEWLKGELAGEDRPVVLGHSNGGRISMHYDAAYPGHFGKLILLNSAGIEVAPQKLSRKRQLLKMLAKVLAPLKHIPGLKKIVYRLLGSDYGSAPDNMKKTLANMLASDASFDASRVTVPTVIIWGKEDTTTPLSMGRALHEQIQNSSLVIMPEWQHAPYRTHPEQLAKEILRALEVKQ